MIIYALHGDDICRIGSRGTDTCHDGDEYLEGHMAIKR